MKKLNAKIIDALVENGYIIIENAFGDDFATKLKRFAQKEKDFKRAGISQKDKLHVDDNRRRDKIHWLNNNTACQKEFLEFTKELKQDLNKELFLGLRYYEAHFAIYNKGDFYETHFDNFKGSKNRVVTTVYYLNDNWKEGDGGEIIIYDKHYMQLAKIPPKSDTLIVFLSEEFPHEVLPSNTKRYSIAGWFRVDKISS